MKKVAIILTAAVLSITPALADISQTVDEYNLHSIITSAKELSGQPEVDQREKVTDYRYMVSDNIIVSIGIKGGEFRVYSCICKDESESAEFLAQCASAFITIGGYSSIYESYADLLDLFLQARAGESTEQRNNSGLVYQLTKEKFGYLFMVAR